MGKKSKLKRKLKLKRQKARGTSFYGKDGPRDGRPPIPAKETARGRCRDCSRVEEVSHAEWRSRFGARRTACGGRMDKLAPNRYLRRQPDGSLVDLRQKK